MEFYLVLLPVALLLLTSKIFMKLCEKVHLPSVIGMLIAGVLIGMINYIPGKRCLTKPARRVSGFSPRSV